MTSYFHNRNYFIFPHGSCSNQVLKQLGSYFTDIEYQEIDNFGILYKKGLDPKQCLVEYLDYHIDYYEYIIPTKKLTVEHRGKTKKIDVGKILSPFIDEYKKDLSELKKTKASL